MRSETQAPAPIATSVDRPRVRPTAPIYLELLTFLWDEAAALDDNNYQAWLAMLAPDIEYIMPVQVTRRRDASPMDTQTRHFDETFSSLKYRIKRFEETQQWAENPASRTRRFVTTVQASETDVAGEYDVLNSLLLTRTQDDNHRVELITAARRDVVRVDADGQLKLARRLILADQTVIGTSNLSIFL
jgi:3-phenylpropionate/cinnamic acid dioxygenase small subunit